MWHIGAGRGAPLRCPHCEADLSLAIVDDATRKKAEEEFAGFFKAVFGAAGTGYGCLLVVIVTLVTLFMGAG